MDSIGREFGVLLLLLEVVQHQPLMIVVYHAIFTLVGVRQRDGDADGVCYIILS